MAVSSTAENGVLIEMEPSGGSHANRVEWLVRHFVRGLGDDYAVRVQDTFLIPDGGYYEPDLMVVRPTADLDADGYATRRRYARGESVPQPRARTGGRRRRAPRGLSLAGRRPPAAQAREPCSRAPRAVCRRE